MDENNQNGNVMIKPLPYGCIKKASKVPSILEFNMSLDSILYTDKVGHLFIVDPCFSWKNKKKAALGKFYEQTVQNISYFNKKKQYL